MIQCLTHKCISTLLLNWIMKLCWAKGHNRCKIMHLRHYWQENHLTLVLFTKICLTEDNTLMTSQRGMYPFHSRRLLFVSLWFMSLLDSAGRKKEDLLPVAASEIGKVKAPTQGRRHINAVYCSMYHRQLNHKEGSLKILRCKFFCFLCF